MGMVVIAAYRPKPGQEAALVELLRRHHGILKLQGLVTDQRPIVARAADGTYVEIFEWRSREAVEAAHHNAAVKELWTTFESHCAYVKPGELAEMREAFPNFERVHLPAGL